MAKIEKIGNTQVIDNKEDNFFYFPMISMACTGSGYENKEAGRVLMLFPLSFYTYLLCPLLMGTDIWQEIEVLNQEFVRLGISQSVDSVDYEKYYLYSLITHSTAIEGSTLTELDTQLLFMRG